MRGPVFIAAAGLALVVTLAAVTMQGSPPVRPFVALAHAGQVVQPHQPVAAGISAFFLFDDESRLLTFTLGDGSPELLFTINGPAKPGALGSDVAGGNWAPGPITVGPLTDEQERALDAGRLYIQLFRPSAIPELQAARRGQILPVPGVRYPH